MADVNILEQGTYPAEPMQKTLFSKLPSDLRFTNTEYRQFVPHTAVDKNSGNITAALILTH